ncbi:hypothetical protein ASD63_31350 [Ensifer sp. Root558]|nr:hypothetical protein ASD63_31350 [Ensifer sp. Root558]
MYEQHRHDQPERKFSTGLPIGCCCDLDGFGLALVLTMFDHARSAASAMDVSAPSLASHF